MSVLFETLQEFRELVSLSVGVLGGDGDEHRAGALVVGKQVGHGGRRVIGVDGVGENLKQRVEFGVGEDTAGGGYPAGFLDDRD